MKPHHIEAATSRTERLIELHEGAEGELLLFAPALKMAVDVSARRHDSGGRADMSDLCLGNSSLIGWRAPSFGCELPAGKLVAIAWPEYDPMGKPAAQVRVVADSLGCAASEYMSSGDSR